MKKKIIIAIIQARMKSNRLPGKVLKKIDNETILEKIFNSLKKCKNINETIIATSKDNSDNKIVNVCKKKKIQYYRGDLQNVASRFYEILKIKKSDFFIRTCADSPFLDYRYINNFITLSGKNNYDILTNTFPKTFPKGQSIEIVKSNFFKKKFKDITKKKDLEHVTTYFYDNKKKFKIKNIFFKKNLSNINLCVDTKDDLKKAKLITKLINKKYKSKFYLENFIKILDERKNFFF